MVVLMFGILKVERRIKDLLVFATNTAFSFVE